jgi:nitronate monooxygenase
LKPFLTIARSTFHDQILGTTVWPAYYDGRAIVTRTYEDHINGMPIEKNTERYNEAKANEDGEILVTWS